MIETYVRIFAKAYEFVYSKNLLMFSLTILQNITLDFFRNIIQKSPGKEIIQLFTNKKGLRFGQRQSRLTNLTAKMVCAC